MEQRVACTNVIARTIKPLPRAALVVLVLLMVGLLIAGVPTFARQATPSPVGPPGVQIKTTDSSCEIDVNIAQGTGPYVGVTLRNEAPDPHQVQFVELPPGTPVADLSAEAIQDALSAEPGTDQVVRNFVGGPGAIQTGGIEEIVLELPVEGDQPANYAAVCSIPGQEAQGNVQPLQVNGPENGAQRPEANVSVILTDDAIEMPISIPAGRQLWEVTNEGTRPHDLVLVVLTQSMTQQTIQDFIQENNGALPVSVAAGGMRVLSPGKSGWILVDLPPGQYLAICDIDQTSRVFSVNV